MFLGEYAHSMDEKGRVAVPARFREQLREGIILTRGFDHCLQVYPHATFDQLRQRVSELSIGNMDVRNLRRLLFAGAAEVELDKQGRVLIPQNLREYAGLKGQAILVGNDNYFEIWSEERWQSILEAIDNSGSHLAEQLAALGV